MLRYARQTGRAVVTLCLLLGAGVSGVILWNEYVVGPWTRDGVVAADVVTMAPEVSGRIIKVNVGRNQYVHKDDVLYEIDPFDYQVALASAESDVLGRESQAKQTQAAAVRRRQLTTLSTSVEETQTFVSSAEQARTAYAAAIAALSQAKTNLARTKVLSPVNGYVTNLLIRAGDYATKGTRNITVIDNDNFWVIGYFEETKLHGIHVNDPATVQLMGYDQAIEGHVEGIARGINSENYAPGTLGLASVNPVFTWVRLAQRIPVNIKLDSVPDGVVLSAGETATVAIRSTAGRPSSRRGMISRTASRLLGG